MNNSIEDVLMSDNNRNHKKKGHPILLLFFLITVILGGFIYFKYYYQKEKVIDYTDDFFEYLSTNNINAFLNDSLYTEIVKKLKTRDYETDSNANFSSTIKMDELKDIDVSKMLLSLNTIYKAEENRNYFDFNAKYLDNSIINVKAISDKEEFYITSDEIINMYVGGNKKEFYPILKNILNKDVEAEKFGNITPILLNRIEYTDFDFSKYSKVIKNNIEPGKIKKRDGIIIENEKETLVTTEYELNLSQKEVNLILKEILENIKNDDKILDKLVTKNTQEIKDGNISTNLNTVGQTNTVQDNTNIVSKENENNTVVADEQEQVLSEDIVPEENNEETALPDVPTIENDNLKTEENLNTVENENAVTEVETSNNIEENSIVDETIETLSLEESIQILKKALIGNNENITKEELKSSIQTLTNEVTNLKGNGIKVDIYVYEGNIVKLSSILIDNSSLDLEFDKISEKENKLKLTYLKDTEKNTGFSIEFHKNKKEAATIFNIMYNNIVNQKINKKLKIETKLEGTVLSNNLENSIIVIYTDNQGEIKANLKTDINFESEKQIEVLNETNSFNLVSAEEEYKQNLIEQLKAATNNLYNDKKEKMKLIDKNTQSSEISSGESNVSVPSTEERKAELRNLIIDKISSLMGEASANGEKFELRNLKNLEIEGYNVSTVINANLAIITIEGYTFNIDSEFNLSDG